MVTRPRRNLADVAKREYQLKQQRKRAKKEKARAEAVSHLVGGKRVKTPSKTKKIPSILVGKPKPKKIRKEIKGTQSTVVEREPTPRKKKKVMVPKRRPLFGSKGMKKKYIPKKAGGGTVDMQKIRKYKEGGIVVHDQSTIKNL